MAPPKETKFKVAAAHAAPVFMNKAATVKKTVQLIEKAAADDIKLLVFPETFIPGYPVSKPYLSVMCKVTQPLIRSPTSTVLGRMLPTLKTGRCPGKVRGRECCR